MDLETALAAEAHLSEGRWLEEQLNKENHICSDQKHE
jgi:hypothetical protein